MKKYKTVNESRVLLSQLMQPSHSNFGGKIHGGYILNLMDQIAFASASKFSENYCVTASVDRVDFLNPIEVGELVTLKSSVNYVGNSSMVVGIRVDSQNIQTGELKHCNSSYFTMVAKDDSGKSVSVPRLILKNKDDIRRFMKSVKRIEAQKNHQSSTEKTDYLSEETLNFLKENFDLIIEI